MSRLNLEPIPISMIFGDEKAEFFVPSSMGGTKNAQAILPPEDPFAGLSYIDTEHCVIRTARDHSALGLECSEERLIVTVREAGYEPLPPHIGWLMLQNPKVIPSSWRVRDFSFNMANAKKVDEHHDVKLPMFLHFSGRIVRASHPSGGGVMTQSYVLFWDNYQWAQKPNNYGQTMVRNAGIVCIPREDMERYPKAA